jgi:hypothetical protein
MKGPFLGFSMVAEFVPSSELNSYVTAALSRYLAKAARESDPWI